MYQQNLFTNTNSYSKVIHLKLYKINISFTRYNLRLPFLIKMSKKKEHLNQVNTILCQ